MSKKDLHVLSQVLMTASVVCVVLAGIGYLGTDIWLASTQWLLVSAVAGIFALYYKNS